MMALSSSSVFALVIIPIPPLPPPIIPLLDPKLLELEAILYPENVAIPVDLKWYKNLEFVNFYVKSKVTR